MYFFLGLDSLLSKTSNLRTSLCPRKVVMGIVRKKESRRSNTCYFWPLKYEDLLLDYCKIMFKGGFGTIARVIKGVYHITWRLKRL